MDKHSTMHTLHKLHNASLVGLPSKRLYSTQSTGNTMPNQQIQEQKSELQYPPSTEIAYPYSDR